MSRPHGRARVNASSPQGFGQCDRCGFWYNLADLMWQLEWAGTHVYNKRILVCQPCYDIPQEQLRTIILPPDPPPLMNARVPAFDYEEQIPRLLWTGQIRCTQDGQTVRVLEYNSSTGEASPI